MSLDSVSAASLSDADFFNTYPNAKVHNFDHCDKNIGGPGALLAMEQLYHIPETSHSFQLYRPKTVVVSVEADKNYQKKDIDFLVTRHDGKQISVEVKTDTYTTGNLFLEYISNLEWCTPGCFVKCDADVLLYYLAAAGQMLVIPTKQAQRWFCKSSGSFQGHMWKQVHNKDKKTGKRKETWGVAYPIFRFINEVNSLPGGQGRVQLYNVPPVKEADLTRRRKLLQEQRKTPKS